MTLQARIMGGFGFALALLLVVSVISFSSTAQLIEEAAWTEHTQEVIARLFILLATVDDAETGGRGYTITGDAAYLEPYLKAVAQVDTDFQALRQITADNPRQQQRLDTLAPLLAKRMAAQRK